MITVFGQAGDLIDGCLNWFVNLNPIWQFIMFAAVVAIIFYVVYLRSRN